MDSTKDVTTPGYFQSTFGVGAAQAAELSRQAGIVGQGRGGGITAESPDVPATPSVPARSLAPGAISARSEYEQIMADRAAGKINDAQWNSKFKEREQSLATLIAEGFGERSAPTQSAPSTTALDHYFAAPMSAEDYRFPRGEQNPTDEQIDADRALKVAMHQARMPQSMVETIASNLREASRTLAHETPEQYKTRIDGNRTRMTAMWAKEGITFEDAMHTIDNQLVQWSRSPTLRSYIANVARFLGPIDLDLILQFAKHNRAGGR